MEVRIRKSGYPVYELGQKEISQNIVDGPFGTQLKVEEYKDSGVPLLRVSNCRTGEIRDDGELVFISEEKHQELIRSEVLPGDVVVTKAGAILGYTAVFPKELIKGNITSHLAAIRLADDVVPEFLAWYLSSPAGIKQIYRWGNKTTRPELNTDEVRKILVPLPPSNTQRALVAEMEAARAARQSKLAEAEELLKGMDGFVLAQLGLKPAQEKNTRKIFAMRFGAVRSRFDVDYHTPYFRNVRMAIQNSTFEVVSLGQILQKPLTSGFAAGRGDQAEDAILGVPHVRPFNIKPNGEFNLETIKFVPRENVGDADWLTKDEVLFNNTNSTEWVGKSTVFDGESECACSNHITRLFIKPEKAEPIFIAAMFNALRSIGLFGLLSTNFNNQAGINAETLTALQIPLPPLEMQKTIAGELSRRRERARRLRAEAESVWGDAKEKFEKVLLAN